MGLSTTIYLGPYLECRTRVEEAVEKVRSCPVDSCPRYGKWAPTQDVFCSLCGDEIKPVEVKTVSVLPHIEEDVLFDHRMCRPSGSHFQKLREPPACKDYWVGNLRNSDLGRHYSVDDGPVFVPGPQQYAELQHFRKFYEKEIALLKAEYGEGNIDLKWGLLVYTS